MQRSVDHSRKALGRGLSSLIPEKGTSEPPVAQTSQTSLASVSIDAIRPNPLQPRSAFHPDRLQELAQSVRANGILQPLIVRRVDDHFFELVAGERRWRAAKLAGLDSVPVVIQDLADDKLLEISLVENIQREDLNHIEVAHAFQRLSQELGLSHEEIGQRTGKDRSTITNTLRLLRLPEPVQLLLAERKLNMGHARAILGLPTTALQQQVAEKAAAQSLSVRQVERLVQKMTQSREPTEPDEAVKKVQDANVKAAMHELERVLGTRVRIVEGSEDRGKIEIDYFSNDDLDRIYGLMVGNASRASIGEA